jgi:hypothetical protein
MTGTTPEIHGRISVRADSTSITGTEADWKEVSVGHMHLRIRHTTQVVQHQHQIMTESLGCPVPRLSQHEVASEGYRRQNTPLCTNYADPGPAPFRHVHTACPQ